MNLYFFFRRFRRLNLPAAMLIAILQRSPIVRIVAVAESLFVDAPVASVVRSVLTAVASLGAVQSMAGATPLTVSSGSTTGVSVTTGTSVSIFYSVRGTDTPPLSWRVVGSIPPGLNFSGLTGSGGVVNVTEQNPLHLGGTPTSAGSYTVTMTAYEGQNATLIPSPDYQYTITVTGSSLTAPSISTQPTNQTATVGGSATFTVVASGNPTPTYQWQKNGVDISGATNSSLTLNNVQTSDAGTYMVTVSNSAGSLPSSSATLTVNPLVTVPTISLQPVSQTIVSGSTVVFSAAATNATSVRWQLNGSDIAGATTTLLVINGATAANAGSYKMIATNSAGSTTTNSATLSFVSTTDIGRLINLSINTTVAASSPQFTVGTVVGGAGTSGTKAVLIRAGGPSLAPYTTAALLADPQLVMRASGTIVASNDNWGTGGASTLSAIFNQVGAYPFVPDTSKDAAVYNSAFSSRDYTIDVSGVGGTTGTVLAELYDATPSSSYTLATPRLINISVNKPIDAGTTLTAGFVIGGSSARTVLIRVIGPGLSQFGVPNVMSDPQLALNNLSTGTVMASNDNWGGDPQLTTIGNSVAAFAITNGASKDAMLLITLAPGGYTVDASGVGGVGGTAIVEVYEVP